MAAKRVSPASPLGEKHIFENQTVKLGKDLVYKANDGWIVYDRLFAEYLRSIDT